MVLRISMRDNTSLFSFIRPKYNKTARKCNVNGLCFLSGCIKVQRFYTLGRLSSFSLQSIYCFTQGAAKRVN